MPTEFNRGLLFNPASGAFRILTPEVRLQNRLRHMSYVCLSWSFAVNNAINNYPEKLRAVGVTLTYRPGIKWQPLHISNYFKYLKWYLGRRLVAYCWVAELQSRGALHYHVCLIIHSSVYLPDPDQSYISRGDENKIATGKLLRSHALRWSPMWPYGMSNVKTLRGPSSKYLTKYLQKGNSDIRSFPRGVRISGSSLAGLKSIIDPLLLLKHRLSKAKWAVQCFIRDLMPEPDFNSVGWIWDRLPGGNHVIMGPNTCVKVRSEFEFSFVRLSADADIDADNRRAERYRNGVARLINDKWDDLALAT